MPRYPVESVRRHGRGHGGTPSVMVTLGAPQGGSSRYMVFEESAQGPRAVTEIRRAGTLQSIHIPMDYPPAGPALTVIERGQQLREAIHAHGDDAAQTFAAAQDFVDAVERFIAQVYAR